MMENLWVFYAENSYTYQRKPLSGKLIHVLFNLNHLYLTTTSVQQQQTSELEIYNKYLWDRNS